MCTTFARSDSVSQIDAVLPAAANSTHKIEQVRVCVDGHTAHVSGLLVCAYAHTAPEYTQLMANTVLPAPKAGLVYCETPAGTLVFDGGRIRVKGGTVDTQYRFHDSFTV